MVVEGPERLVAVEGTILWICHKAKWHDPTHIDEELAQDIGFEEICIFGGEASWFVFWAKGDLWGLEGYCQSCIDALGR